MAGRFEVKTVVDRPIEEVFAFLADGENDPKFSSRVLEISKRTDGPAALSRKPFTVGDFQCEIRGRSGPDSGPILGAEDIRCSSGERSFRFSFGD